MQRSEKWKTLFCFGMFGCVVVSILSRLVYLQVGRADLNRNSVRLARNVYDAIPAPRGAILDRLDRPLAYDRLVLEVRAEFTARVAKGTDRIPRELIEFVASRLASHIAVGTEEPATRGRLQQKLRDRMAAARHAPMATNSKKFAFLKVDFLVAKDLDSHEAVRRLRDEAKLWRAKREMPGRLHLDFRESFVRTYPDREFTIGPVGNHYIAKFDRRVVHGVAKRIPVEGFRGLESCRGLWPSVTPPSTAVQAAAAQVTGPDGFYRLAFKDSRRRRFWTGVECQPQPAASLRSTLDLDLQRLAHAELRTAATTVTEKYQSPYDWGALVLVELATGDVLAMASHYPGRQGVTPFAPIENAFEPGSVVKPLMISVALDRGKIRWSDEFDCTPTMPRNGKPVPGHERRIIRDDHRCGVLTPHGIIAQSSNIGAVLIGMRLGAAGMREYLQRFGFCTTTNLGLPAEVRGRGPEGGIDGLPAMPERKFGRFTGPSLSFGYEINVTAVQLARAYLRLLSGRPRELRLASEFDTGTKRLRPADSRSEPRFLQRDTIARVRSAMAAVVAADDHATGRQLHQMLVELGHSPSLIAGKTGTSDSGIGGVRAKTATFVGYAPADAPRYLVVCVLRKDRAVRFYGGSYAAPPAGRLLLGALALERKDRSPPDKQVSAWTGVRAYLGNQGNPSKK